MGAINLPEEEPINVLHTVVEDDALNLVVVKVPQVDTINVSPTEVEHDALIVLTGSTLGLDQNIMMVIVRHVLSKCFPMMNVVRFYIYIRKKSVFVMPSMRILKDLYTTSHCIRVSVIAR